MIIIDTREIKLIELIKSVADFKIPYIIENLQIGDIIIRHQITENNVVKTYNIIIERKCITDMIASIKDGRYKEQKLRLLSEISKNTNTTQCIVCYLLEGSQNELRLPQDKNMLNGSIISSIFRDKIPILRTFTLQETQNIITRLHERLNKDITDFFPKTIPDNTPSNTSTSNTSTSNTPTSSTQTNTQNTIPNSNLIISDESTLYLQSIKKCKKENLTPILWNKISLSNIPGISTNIAAKISEYYPSIKKLYRAYNECDTEITREMMLADIILTDNGKQKRRIGDVISKRVYEYIYKEDDTDEIL